MQRLSYLRAGGFCWLVLILVSVSNAQEAADAPGAEAAPKPEILQAPQALPLGQRSHGIRLDAAGRLRGVTATIDANALELVPEPDVDVIFVQQGRIIAQGRSDGNGRFFISGLTPQAVYSVIARSARRISLGQYSAFSVAVFPAAEQVAAANGGARFTSLVRLDEEETGIANMLSITTIPAQDLAAVGLPQTFPDNVPPGTPLSQTTGGGGGGGGGGGVGGAGLGAAAAIAAAAAAGGNSGSNVASPFTP